MGRTKNRRTRALIFSLAVVSALLWACLPQGGPTDVAHPVGPFERFGTIQPVSESAVTASPQPTLTSNKGLLTDVILLYARDCGLYTFPVVPALDQAPLREVYAGAADCNDLSMFLTAYAPVVSPDGKKLVIPTIRYKTWFADLTTGALRLLASDRLAVTWSPESDRITYVLGDSLYTWAVTDPQAAPVARFTERNLLDLFARWSPDGRWIAATSFDPRNQPPVEKPLTLWVIPTAGGTAVNLGTFPAAAMQWAPQQVVWSPDSRTLLMGITMPGVTVSLDGQVQQPEPLTSLAWWPVGRAYTLTGGTAAGWAFSSDGRHLAYFGPGSGKTDLFMMDVTSRERQLVTTMASGDIRWTPEGRRLVVGIWEPDMSTTESGEFTIWIMPAAANSRPELLLHDARLIDVLRQP